MLPATCLNDVSSRDPSEVPFVIIENHAGYKYKLGMTMRFGWQECNKSWARARARHLVASCEAAVTMYHPCQLANLWQIHFAIWDKYNFAIWDEHILQFEPYMFYNLSRSSAFGCKLRGSCYHVPAMYVNLQTCDKYILQFETNTFCNLRKIYSIIWNKYILPYDTNTFYNLRQINFAI